MLLSYLTSHYHTLFTHLYIKGSPLKKVSMIFVFVYISSSFCRFWVCLHFIFILFTLSFSIQQWWCLLISKIRLYSLPCIWGQGQSRLSHRTIYHYFGVTRMIFFSHNEHMLKKLNRSQIRNSSFQQFHKYCLSYYLYPHALIWTTRKWYGNLHRLIFLSLYLNLYCVHPTFVWRLCAAVFRFETRALQSGCDLDSVIFKWTLPPTYLLYILDEEKVANE